MKDWHVEKETFTDEYGRGWLHVMITPLGTLDSPEESYWHYVLDVPMWVITRSFEPYGAYLARKPYAGDKEGLEGWYTDTLDEAFELVAARESLDRLEA